MAPLKQPESLAATCLRRLKSWLASVLLAGNAERSLQEQVPALPDDDNGWLLPPGPASDLLQSILEDWDICRTAKVQAFLALHTGHSKRLKFQAPCPKNAHRQVVQHLLGSSSNLEQLDMKGVWLGGDGGEDLKAEEAVRNTFCDALRQMTNLKSLHLPYMATDQMLEVVLGNCPRLAILDLFGSTQVTDAGVMKMLGRLPETGPIRQSLQYLNLGGPGSKGCLKPRTVAELLYAFQNLVSLGSYPFLTKVLDWLQYEIDGYYQTKLRYVHDRDTAGVDELLYYCPDLVHVYLDGPKPGVVTALLRSNPGLKHLKVSKVNCREINDLADSDVLRASTSGLLSLDVVSGRESLDLAKVSAGFRQLRRLAVYYSMGVHVSSVKDLTFRELRDLTVYATEVRDDSSAAILRNCPKAERVTLSACESLTDDGFCEILDRNPLPHLRELSFLAAPRLTKRSVWTMVTCLERIVFIGRLDCWNVNWWDVEDIRAELKACNVNVKLWEAFPAVDRQAPVDDNVIVMRDGWAAENGLIYVF